MTDDASPNGSGARGERLESWKSIAAYLDRDVRTLQRWESREGMPVHRHLHDQQASVYAFTRELDDWRDSRAAAAPPEPDATGSVAATPPAHRRFPWLPVAGALAAGLALTLAWWVSKASPAPPAASGRAPVLLLADISTAATSQAALDSLIRERWRRAGGMLLPPARVRAVLPLLRFAPDQALSPAVAMRLAERTGEVDAVAWVSVTGEAPRRSLDVLAWAGDTSGREFLRVRRDVASGRELDAAVTEAMAALAARAAAEPPRTKAAFSPVTTSSLAALRRYDEADALMRQDTWTAAIPLLEEALALDPAFGSAHAHLAWVLSNIGRPRADWEAQLVRAEALAPGVSEAEQAFIAGTALHLRGNQAEAAPDWARVLHHHPTHYWALGNLAGALRARGATAESARLLGLRATAHPSSLISQMVAADIQAHDNQGSAVRGHVDDMAARIPAASSGERSVVGPWLSFAQTCQAWQRGDVTQARIATERSALLLERDTGAQNPHHHYALGLAYLGLGLTRRAGAIIGRVRDHRERQQMVGLAAYARGDREEARARLRGLAASDGPLPAVAALLPELDLDDDARDVLARWDRERYWPDHLLAPLRAQLLMRQGHQADALRVIAQATDALAQPTPPHDMMPTSGLLRPMSHRVHARLLSAAGRDREAIALLARAVADKEAGCTAYTFAGWQYLLMMDDLVGLHQKVGDEAGAAVVAGARARHLATGHDLVESVGVSAGQP